MKKILTLIIMFFLNMQGSWSQVVIAQWTFPTGSPADSLADGGIPSNLNKPIRTQGGTSAIDFSKNGYTTKAAQATGWDNGTGLKCWVVEVTTTDYKDLNVNSKQQSGGNNPGPRDWKVQYCLGAGGNWADVPDAILNVRNDWTTGVLDSIDLPDECKNQPSVFIRWIMTSDTNSAGDQVASNGISKIDDIVFTGKPVNAAIPEQNLTNSLAVYPNPCTDRIRVAASESMSQLVLTDATGRIAGSCHPGCREVTLTISQLPAGFYIIRAITATSHIVTASFIRID